MEFCHEDVHINRSEIVELLSLQKHQAAQYQRHLYFVIWPVIFQ